MEDRQPKKQLFDPCRVAVRRWPDLRGEQKLAWEFLWELAGRKPGRIMIHIGRVAEDQGIWEKNARRHVKTLASHGLLQLLDTDTACWTMYLEDPLQIQKARVVRADPQGELFTDDNEVDAEPEPESSDTIEFSPAGTTRSGTTSGRAERGNTINSSSGQAEHSETEQKQDADRSNPCGNVNDFQNKTRSGTTSGLANKDKETERAHQTKHKDKDKDNIVFVAKTRSGTTSGRAFEQPREPNLESKHLFESLLEKFRRITGEQPLRAQAIAEQIHRSIADPGMPMSKCLQIAWEIVHDTYPQSKLARVLANLDEEHRKWVAAGSPSAWKNGKPWRRGAYFQGAMRRSFEEAGLDYLDKKAEGKQRPQHRPRDAIGGENEDPPG